MGSAPKFVTNFYYNCMGDNNIGVPVGSDLVLDVAWGAKTRGLVLDFMQGHTPMTVMIDGVPLANPEQYWGAPHLESGLWVVRWLYDTGWVSSVPIDAWHSIDILSLATHRITDGVSILDDGTHKPRRNRLRSPRDVPCTNALLM